jgi:hypothetical protein
VEQADKHTGEVREAYTTEQEPDGVLRRRAVTAGPASALACAEIYRRDAWHRVAACRARLQEVPLPAA